MTSASRLLAGAVYLLVVHYTVAGRLLLQAPPAMQFVVLGDSISDVGRRFAVSPKNSVPNPKWYSNGRYSNGPIWAEYLPTLPSSAPIQFTSMSFGGGPACGSNRDITSQQGGGDSAAIISSNGQTGNASAAQQFNFYPGSDGAFDQYIAPWLDIMIDQLLASTNGSTPPSSPNYLDPVWPAAAARAVAKGAPVEPFIADQRAVSGRNSTLTAQERGQPAGAHALLPPGQRIVVLQVGANDYLNQLENVTDGDLNFGLPEYPLQVAACIKAGAERLIAAGDTRIVLVTLPAIDKLPKVQQFSFIEPWVAKIQSRHNDALRKAAAELSAQYAARNVQVVMFELGYSTDNIIANASQLNLTNTEDTCLQYGSAVGDALSNIPIVGDELSETVNKLIGSNPKGKCENPDNHLFWDAVHPTTRVHALLAERFVTDLRQLGWWT